MNNKQHTNPTPPEDEIDLLELAKTLWKGRRTIIKYTLIFACIGLFIAIFSPKEYTAKTIMVPQTSGSKVGGSLGGLAAMAGINLGGGTGGEVIPPSLYPKIVNSIPFKLELLQTKLHFEGIDQPVTYQDYYENYHKIGVLGGIKKYTVGLPGLIIAVIKKIKISKAINKTIKTDIVTVTRKQENLFVILSKQVAFGFNEKGGYIELAVKMPEPLAAAELAEKAQNLLQIAVTEFKLEKVQDQLSFIEGRFYETEKNYEKKESDLAFFKDKNIGLINSRSLYRLSKLQRERDLAFGVYSELAKQLESKKINIKEKTPIFTILQPVSVPNMRSSPKRAVIVIIYSFFGFILSSGVLIGKIFYGNFIKQLNSRIKNDN